MATKEVEPKVNPGRKQEKRRTPPAPSAATVPPTVSLPWSTGHLVGSYVGVRHDWRERRGITLGDRKQ
jgi:hypothetical protein